MLCTLVSDFSIHAGIFLYILIVQGHFEELQKLLEMVNASRKDPNLVPLNSRERQTFIMSATLSLVHKPPQHVKKQKTKSSEVLS